MRNSISEFPYISPRCPKLSSLLLQDNDLCGSIPDPFFVHLRGLNVLDLSNTRIESLPGSVSDLENLSTLRLTQCQNLKHVPSLAKLTALRKLDLMKSRIKEIPHGLEMLVNLRYLGLDAPYPKNFLWKYILVTGCISWILLGFRKLMQVRYFLTVIYNKNLLNILE